jgi:DNA transformation protein and related proteins
MSALIDSYLDLLEPLGQVTVRRMFGGHGFYRDGVMFALEAFGRLFIKADAENKSRFTEAGCLPFAYTYKDGREMVMSYFEPPESAFINPQKMRGWAMLGVEAALRKAKPAVKKSTAKKRAGGKRK